MDLFEKAKRGGVCFVGSQYAKANNKHLPDFDPSAPSSYILYLDANSSYAWAMRQTLPTGNFKHQRKRAFLDSLPLKQATPTDRVATSSRSICTCPTNSTRPKLSSPPSQTPARSPRLFLTLHLRLRDPDPASLAQPFSSPSKQYVCTLPMLNLLTSRGWKVDRVHLAVSFNQAPGSSLTSTKTSNRNPGQGRRQRHAHKLLQARQQRLLR